ncbi:MAG: type II secretion system F family protein [Deltaproteobacteria bacterium]|nr:type II secretion system F family protein [Deltaproteobacteria bacterium]
MTAYAYKARDMNGLLVMGVMEGEGAEPVRLQLADKGLIPIHVAPGKGNFSAGAALNLFNRVAGEELMLFTRQFATLFKAGMDMQQLLHTLGKQTKNKYFSEAILKIKTDVAGGASLSRAFSQHPKIFGDLYTNMLAAGEEAGILDEVLGQIGTLLDKEITLKASVKSAMLYPKIVIFVLICASAVLMTFVVPKFSSFYGHYGADLPLPTKIMVGTSDFVRSYWYMVAGAVAAAVFGFKKWSRTLKGKWVVDRLKWKIPVFGALGQKVANARFANILGALYKAGISITEGLEITSKTIGNEAFGKEIMQVKGEVKKGNSIAAAMREGKYFSPLLVEATAIGEKSGALDQMYFSIGGHYDAEVAHTLKNLTTLLEPMLLFGVFGMVTMFALAIFLPMWNLSKVVLH